MAILGKSEWRDTTGRRWNGKNPTGSGNRMQKTGHPPGFGGTWRSSDFEKTGGGCDPDPEGRQVDGANVEESGGWLAARPYSRRIGGVEKRRMPFGALKRKTVPRCTPPPQPGRKETNALRGTETIFLFPAPLRRPVPLVEKRRMPFGALKLAQRNVRVGLQRYHDTLVNLTAMNIVVEKRRMPFGALKLGNGDDEQHDDCQDHVEKRRMPFGALKPNQGAGGGNPHVRHVEKRRMPFGALKLKGSFQPALCGSELRRKETNALRGTETQPSAFPTDACLG